MKNITLFALLLVFSSFNLVKAQESKSATIKSLISGIIELETSDLDEATPILSFNELAKTKAAKTIVITKENMAQSLTDAKEFKNCIVTVGKHTIAKVTDLSDCKQSGAWGTCMPFCEGYVQKGSLQSKSDYMNNIIGIPDSQERLMFLFN